MSYFSESEAPPSEIMGAPGYIAPEVAAGERPTPASDVFQLGVWLRELLVGARAFDVDRMSDDEILNVHQEGRFEPWPEVLALPREITRLVTSATAYSPEDRPEDGTALFHALSPLVRKKAKGAREVLSAVSRDLVRSNRDRPAAFYV